MNLEKLRKEIQSFLKIKIHTNDVDFKTIEVQTTDDYERHLIKYQGSENDEIKAYLFLPTHQKIIGSILVHHQHHGQRHLGKSEVAGIVGDPFQYFCPALAKRGIITLAPDSICFEDRRKNMQGIIPDPKPDNDWLQHYNEMCYRLLQGKSLMKKVIEDSSIAISILYHLKENIQDNIGILGHSYGGNTVIFHSPFDERIKYSCSSGSVCSFQTKFEFGTGIEMAEVIPGFVEKFKIEDLLKCVSPRKLLFLSGSEDKYSQDAQSIYEKIKPSYSKLNSKKNLHHQEFLGQHGLNKERFIFIINWFINEFNS